MQQRHRDYSRGPVDSAPRLYSRRQSFARLFETTDKQVEMITYELE